MKRKNKKLLTLFMLLSIVYAFPVAKNSKEILKYVSHSPIDSIIFIDIDDTIITPISKTFSSPVYKTLIDDIKHNKSQYDNYEEIISNWRLKRKIMLTDSSWPEVLSILKNKHQSYGLTKMDIGKFGNIESIEKWRYEELKLLNIFFSDNIKIPTKPEFGSVFYKGIFVTGKNSKSKTIENYSKYLNIKNLILIDDREEHLQDLKNFCKKNSINFTGILFKSENQANIEQDPIIAQTQKEYLIQHAKWLEDDEAQKICCHDYNLANN